MVIDNICVLATNLNEEEPSSYLELLELKLFAVLDPLPPPEANTLDPSCTICSAAEHTKLGADMSVSINGISSIVSRAEGWQEL